jgi:hypothetical protein
MIRATAIRRYREVMYYMTRKEYIEEKKEKRDTEEYDAVTPIAPPKEPHKGRKIDIFI